MAYVESKTRSVGQIAKKRLHALEATYSVQSSGKLVRMFPLMISWTTLKIVHIEKETRSLRQILQKRCVRFWDHDFRRVLIKVGHNVIMFVLMISRMSF